MADGTCLPHLIPCGGVLPEESPQPAQGDPPVLGAAQLKDQPQVRAHSL